jgi:dTDP-4-amino-4,6-dideoxygalactose transaminase
MSSAGREDSETSVGKNREIMDSNSGIVEIPFHRIALGEEEVQAVAEVIRSGWLTMGAKTFEFEREFARYVGAPYAVAVSSCTAALHLALEAIGIHRGDEVLLPTTTFTATAEVVTYLGARPVLVDIQAETLTIDPADAAKRVTPRTRAILPVHVAGQPCDMVEIQSLARKHELRIIEDAAHALPASYHGRRIGGLSEFTAFSFYATKTLTTGEGGMITTGSAEAAEHMRMMRLHGIERDAWKRYSVNGSWRYEVRQAGFKYNLTDLQAALGLVQLTKCDSLREARRRIAMRYSAAFKTIEELQVPLVRKDRESSWHLYILRLRLEELRIDRSEFIRELKRRGIGSSVHFIPLHLHPYYQRKFGYRAGDFPRADAEFQRCISLPIYPTMSEEEVDRVIAAVTEIVQAEALPLHKSRHVACET